MKHPNVTLEFVAQARVEVLRCSERRRLHDVAGPVEKALVLTNHPNGIDTEERK